MPAIPSSWIGWSAWRSRKGLRSALNILLLMGSSPLQWQKAAPTREAADRFYAERLKAQLAHTDANDMLYQFDASREYNPAPKLETIKAPLVAVNSADDLINPPELGLMEREVKRVKRGRYVLIPTGDQTRGHGTHSLPAIWQQHLAALLEESKPWRSRPIRLLSEISLKRTRLLLILCAIVNSFRRAIQERLRRYLS